MTREQIDAAWRSLPEDYKNGVKEIYEALECDSKYKDGYAQAILMHTLFGKHNLTATEEEKTKMMSKEKMRQKLELQEYAAKNRKRLETQEVMLGDVVKVLLGQFAGEKGIVKGIIVPDKDFNNPYYEVDMVCEVPDKYKCRKTLISPNNVIGGLTKSDFEVIGNRMPSEGMLKEIAEDLSNLLDEVDNFIERNRTSQVDWLAYRMELAKEVAAALIAKGHNIAFVPESTSLLVNGIVERLKGGEK